MLWGIIGVAFIGGMMTLKEKPGIFYWGTWEMYAIETWWSKIKVLYRPKRRVAKTANHSINRTSLDFFIEPSLSRKVCFERNTRAGIVAHIKPTLTSWNTNIQYEKTGLSSRCSISLSISLPVHHKRQQTMTQVLALQQLTCKTEMESLVPHFSLAQLWIMHLGNESILTCMRWDLIVAFIAISSFPICISYISFFG